jgi:hypothetical protein
MDMPTGLTRIFILFVKDFKYGNVAKFLGYVGTNAEPILCRIL